MEKTIPAGSVRDRDSDLEGVLIRLKHKPNGWQGTARAFLVEGAALADVVSSVRCTTGAVTTTGGAPAPE